MMKRHLFIFLIVCPLWLYSSCQDDEDKLTGTKPAILLGKWRYEHDSYFFFTPVRHLIETYEFTSRGGTLEVIEYFPEEDKYKDVYTSYYTDWSYDGSEIYFIEKKGRYTSR
jgi:hypothetical protein